MSCQMTHLQYTQPQVQKVIQQAKAGHGDHFQCSISACGHKHRLPFVTSWAVYLLHAVLHQDHIPTEKF